MYNKICVFLLVYVVQYAYGGKPIKVLPIQSSEMKKIVDKHNTLRASVKSSNMRYMTWDSELASMSQTYAKKCQFSHNQYGDHSKFKNSVGENIYVARREVGTFDSSQAIQLWFDEYKDFDYGTRTCVRGKKCGHYTQIVWADTYKIGCGLVMCDYVTVFNQPNSMLFICNYAPAGNVYTLDSNGEENMKIPFLKGKQCSRCEQNDVCKMGLCSNSERDTSLPRYPTTNNGNANVNDNGECSDSISTVKSLTAAVVIISIGFVALLAYTVYRERVRLSLKLQVLKVKHNQFSNQNTPLSSRLNTPRTSIAGNDRNVIHNFINSNQLNVPPTAINNKNFSHVVYQNGSLSAPNSPMRKNNAPAPNYLPKPPRRPPPPR